MKVKKMILGFAFATLAGTMALNLVDKAHAMGTICYLSCCTPTGGGSSSNCPGGSGACYCYADYNSCDSCYSGNGGPGGECSSY